MIDQATGEIDLRRGQWWTIRDGEWVRIEDDPDGGLCLRAYIDWYRMQAVLRNPFA